MHETAIVDQGATIGTDTKIWHFSHVREESKIGRDCSLGQNVYIDSKVKIGSHVKIQNNVSVYQGVTLEDYVFCGPSMVFTNVKTPRCAYPKDESQYETTLVQEGSTIGANVTIICGSTLGKHCMIGAGSVITRNIPDFALCVGNPCEQVGWACECGELNKQRDGFKTWNCPNCGTQYKLIEDRLEKIT